MPRQDLDQVVGPDGTIISETPVIRPVRVVNREQLQDAVQVLRTMVGTFYANGQPTGTPSAVQLRNWNLALTVAIRHLVNELDDLTHD